LEASAEWRTAATISTWLINFSFSLNAVMMDYKTYPKVGSLPTNEY
jgi:hypothetical protein